jgi:RimJ/RimL family protein N-acetyltransferase/carbonic anhydrase
MGPSPDASKQAVTRLPDRIDTPRLVLRAWTVDDVEAMAESITASVEHLRPWMPWAALEPLTLDDRRRLITEWDAAWGAGGDVVYGIFLDGTPIGGSGLHRRRGPGALEIGYWIRVGYTRQGYAKEVTATLTDLAFTVDGIERVEVHHDRANAASRAVPSALGFDLVAETADEITSPGEEGVDCTWAITKADWQARRASAARGPGASRKAGMFDDLLDANRRYRARFHDSGVAGSAAKGLAVLTCIDSRIDPLALLGLKAGDAKIIRNAGARVTEDALRSLVLAANLLGVNRVCVVAHTECAMIGTTDDEMRKRIGGLRGVDATGWEFLASEDQLATLHDDLARIEACELLPPDLDVGAFIFDVRSGELIEVAGEWGRAAGG